MQDLLKELYYKSIPFTISVSDATGEYSNGAYVPKEVNFDIEEFGWEFVCSYANYVLIRRKTVALIKKVSTNAWSYLSINYKDIKNISWLEPTDEPLPLKDDDIPF